MIVILVLAGFPVALILSWIYDVGPHGLVRTSSTEADQNPLPPSKKKPFTSTLTIGILIILLVAQFIYFELIRNPSGEKVPEAIRMEKVAVAPFSNFTGDETLNAFGLMASDWITSGLRELKVQTSSPEMMRKHRDNLRILPGNPEKEVSLFELTGASYVITGSYYARDDQMEVSSRLESTETGDVIYNFPAVSGPLDQKEELVDEVRERIKGYWAVKEAEDLSRYNPPKYEAYRALFECGGFGEVWCLMNALSLDTTFMLARVYLYYSSALWDMDSLHEATGRYIREHRDECTEFKKNYVDFVNHIKQQRYEAEAMDLDKNVELDPKELKSVDWENYLTNPWSGNNEWYIKLWVEGMTGASYARLGMRNEALAQVDTLESMRQDEPNNLNRMFSGEIPYYQARIYAILEEPELSMQALQQSMDEGRMSEWDNYVNDPDLAGLRDYQPYLDLFGLR